MQYKSEQSILKKINKSEEINKQDNEKERRRDGVP